MTPKPNTIFIVLLVLVLFQNPSVLDFSSNFGGPNQKYIPNNGFFLLLNIIQLKTKESRYD